MLLMSRHRWVRLIAIAFAAALLLVVSATPAPALPSPPAPCPTMQIYGVRGSGETQQDHGGYGATTRAVVDKLRQLVPGPYGIANKTDTRQQGSAWNGSGRRSQVAAHTLWLSRKTGPCGAGGSTPAAY